MSAISSQSIFMLIYRLWGHLSSRRRKQFIGLLALMIFVSFLEIISIGSVIPFLGILTNPVYINEELYIHKILQLFGLHPNNVALVVTVVFACAALVAGMSRLLLAWVSTRLSFAAGADLSLNLYSKTLYQPYSVHISRNSSEIINAISSKTGVVISTLASVLTFIGSTIILFTILMGLLFVDPFITIFVFGGFGMIYIIIICLTRKLQMSYSILTAAKSTQVIKSLQEGLGGIRDILIDETQKFYCNIYQSTDRSLRRAQGNSQFIAQSPRFGIEALGMILLAYLAFTLTKDSSSLVTFIPLLGVFALGSQRLLPVMQQCYQSWSGIQGTRASLQDALDLLDQPLPEFALMSPPVPMEFKDRIQVVNLSFRFSEKAPWIIKNLNLTIPKGSRIGFIGPTGSGKSTLIDCLMGLLEPTSGHIEVDGIRITPENNRTWRAHISHVPQSIFLSDSSILENIAFGISKDKIDTRKVKLAAVSAQISETIEGWDAGYQTTVGERGVRLSGGQRQRIGIARALYKNTDVIIFDEATSALDNLTEKSVMAAINRLSGELTVLIVAHRTSTLKSCDLIVEVNKGGVRMGTYEELLLSDI
jgi:ABC-type multidrug transport system fused ATPase/permease subunit